MKSTIIQPDGWQIFFVIVKQSIGLIVLLAASIYYLIKKKNISGVLLVTGLVLTLLFSSLSTIMFQDTILKRNFTKIGIYSALGTFSYYIFAAGFIMLIVNSVKKDTKSYEFLDDTISGHTE